MTMYSSTSLNDPSESGCWKQLDYSEQHGDEGLFKLWMMGDLGVAAHAVCEHCTIRRAETEEATRATGEEVANILITKGRTFRGHQCPPLPAQDVYEGVDIAVQYLLANSLPLDAERIEVEQDYKHPTLPYRVLLDLLTVHEEGEEDDSLRVLTVTDYKTSWQAGENELHTLQRWGQSVVGWRNLTRDDKVDVVRRRVVNLRTWQEYARDINLHDEDDVAMLEQWERRIEALCETADSWPTGERPAVPGAGCLSCPYAHICPDVWLRDPLPPDLRSLAVELAKVQAQRKMLIEMLKESSVDHIAIPGGWVGHKTQEKAIFRRGQEQRLLIDWFERLAAHVPEDLAPVLTSLLSALGLGKGNMDAFAKALYPERTRGIGEIRAEYVGEVTDVKRGSLFGVWVDKEKQR